MKKVDFKVAEEFASKIREKLEEASIIEKEFLSTTERKVREYLSK